MCTWIWLIPRYSIIRANTSLKLISNIWVINKLLNLRTPLWPCINNWCHLGIFEIIMDIFPCFNHTLCINNSIFPAIIFLILLTFLSIIHHIWECLIISLVIFLLLINFINKTANVYCVLEGFRTTTASTDGWGIGVHYVVGVVVLLLAVVVWLGILLLTTGVVC